MPTKWTPKPKPTPPPIPSGGGLGERLAWTLARGFAILLNSVQELLWDILAWPLHRVLESIEAEAAPKLAPLIDVALSGMAANHPLRPLLQEIAHPQAQAFGALLAQAGGGMASAGLGAIIGAVLAEPSYALNRSFTPARLDPQAAVALAWRYPDIAQAVARDMADLGWSSERIEHLMRLGRSFPQGSELLELVRRDPAYEPQARELMSSAGFGQDDIDRMLALRHPTTDAEVARQLWLRQEITEEQHDTMLRATGLTDGDIALLKRLYFPIPGPQDLISMAVREAFNDEFAALAGTDQDFPPDFGNWGRRQGLSDYWAQKYWRAHWQLPSANMGYDMLHRGLITAADLDTLLKALDYSPLWRGKLAALSYNPYTRVDIRRMYQTGILTAEQVLQSYREIGYDDEHATNLTMFTVMGASEAEKDLTKADIVAGYRDGLLGRSEAGEQLQGMGYDASESNFYLARADLDLAKEQQSEAVEVIHQRYVQHHIIVTQARNEMYSLGLAGLEIERLLAKWAREMQAAVKSLSRSDVEQMYQLGLMSRPSALLALGELGYPSGTANQVLTLLDTSVQRDREEAAARGVRYATNSEIAKLLAQGLVTAARAQELLSARGYNGETIAWYLASWQQDRDRQSLAEEAAAEVRAQAAVRKPSASEIRQLWDQSIIDSKEARHLLEGLRYTPAAVANTLTLWEQLKTQAEAKEAAAKQRATEIRPRLLSVAQLHELYLSGVIELGAAGDGLIAQNYTVDDAGKLLTQWELDKGEAAERAELAALSAEARQTRLLSRSQVGELYLARVIERDRAEALLVGLRYSVSDVRDSLTLWDMRLAEMSAAESVTGAAEPERKVKTLARGDVGKLYTESIITEPEARAALANLGYYQTDVDNTIRLWTTQISDEVDAATERAQREAEAAQRQLTRAQIEQMYGLEVLTQEELVYGYYQLGYSDEDITKMLAVLAAKKGGT